MVSTAQVMDMVQKRMVKFEDVEAIFKRMTDQGGIFYNMQYVQSQTVKGQINKLHDAYDQMLNSIGKSNEGTLKDFVAALNNIVKNWRTWAVVIKSIGSAAAIGFITKYTMAITGLGKASMSTMRTMVKLRATVRSLSISWPMLATAGIAAVISTLVSLSKRMEEANKQIDEQNLRLFETRNNFADLKARIEENNRVIKENKSTTETLNKAQSDNKSIMTKLKNEYLPAARTNGYTIKTVCCSYDTDVFEVKQPQIVKWDAIGRSVKRLGIDVFIRVGVESSIEDWILDDMSGICGYLRLKQIPSTLKGTNGYQKMQDLYSRAHKTYKKGYETQELINTIDMSIIRNKRQDMLVPLEKTLGVFL